MHPDDDHFDDPLPPLTEQEEAELQQEIELALEPYRGVAPPAMLAEMRHVLEDGLRTHPVPRQLLKGFAHAPKVDRSGEQRKDGKAEKKDGAEGA